MRQDLRPCLGLPEARLSPPVPRDREEHAFLSCYNSCLTSLLRSCHLSLAWVLTSLTLGVQGPALGPSVPQGPPRHTVTALLRDQDKVLPCGIRTGKCHHPPGNCSLRWSLAPGSLFHKTLWYCCGFVFFQCSLSLSLLTIQKYLCSFALSFDLLF
uniref:Uncharacterized protein n=1 Tax=Bos mutus grunniens TaxID=30521 RepID=A0A8B9WPT7_BOSMU